MGEKNRRQGGAYACIHACTYTYILCTCVYVYMSVYDSLSFEKGREEHETGCRHEVAVGELRGEASGKESLP